MDTPKKRAPALERVLPEVSSTLDFLRNLEQLKSLLRQVAEHRSRKSQFEAALLRQVRAALWRCEQLAEGSAAIRAWWAQCRRDLPEELWADEPAGVSHGH